MDASLKLARDIFIRNLKSLRESALLLQQNDDGTFETVFVTEEFAEILECSAAAAMDYLKEQGILSLTHSEDRIFLRRMLRRKINEDGGSNLILRIKTTKGNLLWCDIHCSFFTEFETLYLYCTFFNITVLKEYEQRIRTSYTNLGNMFYQQDETTLGLFRVNLSNDILEDIQGKDIYGTDSKMTTYSVFLKKRSDSLPFKNERELFIETFDPDELLVKYLKGQTKVSLTVFSIRPDGHSCYVTLTSNTIRHPMTGDVIAFLSEKNANSSKVTETLLSHILSRQFDMVAWLSEGKYGVVFGDEKYISKGNIFPLTKQGDYQTYLLSQVAPVLYGTQSECAAMLESLKLETIRSNLAKSSPYFVNISITVDEDIWYKRFDFYSVDPEGKFCIVLKSDTTDIQRKQIEINTQLKDALSEAQQASVAKTAFLSRMSHEIRTPMNAIIGLGTLAMREQGTPAHVAEYLTKISSSAKYLLSLINDILDMSRIESGRMVLKKEEFSFKTFLDLVNTVLDGQCKERGLSYECRIQGSIDEFYIGDDTKLRQVLINILGNSVKFTNPGGKISLSVEKISSFEGQSNLRFIISDTGIGMDEKFLPTIFEPFSQEDESNTTKYGGSGLGLAITKNIVTLMNGTISVASEKGKGSQFTINVSLREVERPTSTSLSLDPKQLHVLIIDDDPIALKHTHSVLEDIGIASQTCLSGKEALLLISMYHARREPFNLILVNVRMPDTDGIAITRSIRKTIGDDTAIIILTAYSWDDIEQQAREAGVDGFMSKPIFASSLLQEVKSCLIAKNAREENTEVLADLANRHLLLAEDVAINAEIIKELLEILHITVDHVENGALAVEQFASKPPYTYDAILMDVRMPVMDGLEATRKLRALSNKDAKQIPIIAMTANAFDEDVQHSLQAGMNAHLTKPVDPNNLQQTLAQLIGQYDKEKEKNA